MTNNKTVFIIYFILALFFIFQCTGPSGKQGVLPGSMTYYIDPVKGMDENSGLKKNKAWKTFRNINQMFLSPGDRVEIISPGAFDQTLILQGEGTVQNPVKVNFAAGRYDFFTDNMYREKYNISNTNASPDSSKAVGILLQNAKHLSISGKGAEIVYRGKMIMVCVDSSENITVSDLTFDYHRPTVSEYEVVEFDSEYTDIKIHQDSEYKIEDGKLIWVGEGWSHETGLAQELNLETNEVRRMRDPLAGLEFEEIAPFLVRARGSHNLKSGMVYQIRNPFRDYAAVFTRRSKDISWIGINFRFLHGMGLVSQFSENLTYDSVTIAPDPASGRTTAAWADCIHISGCKGKVLVKDCFFSGAHDDAINVHGTYLRVVEQISDTQIKVRFMHDQTYGFMAFNPGDEIEFVGRESLESYGQNKVRDAELLNPKELLITLEEATPNRMKLEDVIENVTWYPEVEVRGCQVHRIPTRGFLLSTRGKILIEDNDFFTTRMSAILVAGDANNWYESGPVRDLTIRNNRFIKCAEPVIRIHPENSTPNDAYHQNILIENNEFVLRNELIVAAKSTNNLIITGNTILSDKMLNDEISVRLNDCSDVSIGPNIYTCNTNCFSQKMQLKYSDLREPIGEWFEAGGAKMDPDNEQRLFPVEGNGVFINGEEGNTEHFVTREVFGDIELELEFMIPKGSNSGVYLQGRYEIQILDSWGRENPGAHDCGGIYYRWIEETEEEYEGTPPPVNASKEPGEWQHYKIRFRAPRFNAAGEKIRNAVFEEVNLNGITLHRNVKVTGPTRESLDNKEEPTGPLMLQGDHGPVAYRNIRITEL